MGDLCVAPPVAPVVDGLCTDCGKPRATSEDEADHNTGECGCPGARALCWQEYCGKCESVFDPTSTYRDNSCQPGGYRCHFCGRTLTEETAKHEKTGYFSCRQGCGSWNLITEDE